MVSDEVPTAPDSVLTRSVKLACVQLMCGSDKDANLKHAASKVTAAAQRGAKIVVLPECFNSPYGTKYFPQFAEPLMPPDEASSPSFYALSRMASENSIYVIAGSIPEVEEDRKNNNDNSNKKARYYNTCLVFDPTGKLLARHRKLHLFDIDIPGGITFRESDILTAGNKVTIVDLPDYGKVGIAICYDIRFPEVAAIAARQGAFALFYPAAFNTTTGPLHWKLLAQSRAVDNQLFVVMCSPARNAEADYHAYGHSMVVDPMAAVLVEAGEGEELIESQLDPHVLSETRRNISLGTQRRFDVYLDVSKS